MLVEIGGREEILAIAVSAGGERTRGRHGLPEERGGVAILRVSGRFEHAVKADRLGHLRIGVEAIEVIARLSQRCHHGLVGEALRQGAIFGIAGHEEQVGVYLVHAAMLGVEHRFELLVVERLGRDHRPVGKPQQHGPRRRAIGQQRRIAQTRITLWSVYRGTPVIFSPRRCAAIKAGPFEKAQTSPLSEACWQAASSLTI